MTNISKLLSEPLYILLISYLVPLRSHPPSPDPFFVVFGSFLSFFPAIRKLTWRLSGVIGSVFVMVMTSQGGVSLGSLSHFSFCGIVLGTMAAA